MAGLKIGNDIHWVGVVDWNLRDFHGYRTGRGSSYNAYLILDEKKCLVDTVKSPFTGRLLENISALVEPGEIDYIISNHLELDHSGAIQEVLRRCPKARLLATRQWIEGAQKYFGPGLPVQPVKTGDTLSLGRRTLQFIEAPMLHWPDSLFTYLPEDGILLPNDAFGQHYASGSRFDDEVPEAVLMDEAARYYANIILPYSNLVTRMLGRIGEMKLDIRLIGPSHGIIWRRPEKILAAYRDWAAGRTRPKAVVAYDTMWGSTAMLAESIAEGLQSAGLETVVMPLKASNRSDVAAEILEAAAFALGTPVLNNLPLPSVADLYTYLKGLRPRKKQWLAFGSYGWNREIIPRFAQEIKEAGFEVELPAVAARFRPDAGELAAAREAGRRLAGLAAGADDSETGGKPA